MCSNDDPVQPNINKTGFFFRMSLSRDLTVFLHVSHFHHIANMHMLVFLSQFIAFETTSEAEMDLLFLYISDNVKGAFS